MQLEMVSLNLGGGLIPLPTVNNWIIMLQHFDGSENFDRNWNEYRNGFGDRGRGEFWLGNEKVHLATAQPRVVYELRVEVSKFKVRLISSYMAYTEFHIGMYDFKTCKFFVSIISYLLDDAQQSGFLCFIQQRANCISPHPLHQLKCQRFPLLRTHVR